MKKLFDETNEFESKYYRTIWYGYIDNEFAPELSDEIKQFIQSDVTEKQQIQSKQLTGFFIAKPKQGTQLVIKSALPLWFATGIISLSSITT